MQPIKALVIDDHENILSDVASRLESLGHLYEKARSQEEAEQLLEKLHFDYVLLDVQIPHRFNSPAREQYGKNLLAKIRQRAGYERTPVIVMTCYGKEGPHLAVEMMKLGASDFINKDDESIPLEKKIEEALARHRGDGNRPGGNPKPFKGGILIFYPDRVELKFEEHIIKVCGDRSDAAIRSILDLLRSKRENDDRRSYDGKHIAGLLKLPRGDEHVRDSIRDFRNLCAKRMTEAGYTCDRFDVVANTKNGYEFKHWIGLSSAEPHGNLLSDSQKALLRLLRHEGRMSRKKLAEKLNLNAETLRSDLEALTEGKQIAREGNGASAFYCIP